MSKKIIGIPGWILGENTYGISKSYLAFISRFGKPLILTPDHDEIEQVDMLMLPGGKDLSPATYNNAPSYFTGDSNPMLEWFDKIMLPQYIDNQTPILGICRGAQRLWVHFGGEMVQHNDTHTQSKNNWDQCHGLTYTEPFRKYEELLTDVNSRHHQTMDARSFIPKELEVIAYSGFKQKVKNEEKRFHHKSIVEIFRHTELPIYGIQGHPEDMMTDDFTPALINSFLHPDQYEKL